MEIINDPREKEPGKNFENKSNGKIVAGIFLIGVGVILALDKSGFDIPDWIISWKTFLIAIGLFIGFKNSFRGFGWVVPIIIGGLFLLSDFYDLANYKRFIGPAALILVGLFIILKPRNKNRSCRSDWGSGRDSWKHSYKTGAGYSSSSPYYTEAEQFAGDRMDVNAIFAGVKRNIISKNFAGGEINSIFGGSEINLMQADFTGTITIDTNQVFGGTKLIIPATWQVQSEITAVLGGVEDRRPITTGPVDQQKTLRLTGSCVLGGLEIVSY